MLLGSFFFFPPHLTAYPSSLPQATKQFLEEINKWTGQYNVSPLSWNVAVKFLMARKFDVLRAIELFHSYRVRERGLVPTPSCGLPALQEISGPRDDPPPAFFLFPTPLGVLSGWKILFQPRRVTMEISLTPVPSPPLRAACMLAGCPPCWCAMPAEHLPLYKGYMCIYIHLSHPGFVKLLLPILGLWCCSQLQSSAGKWGHGAEVSPLGLPLEG